MGKTQRRKKMRTRKYKGGVSPVFPKLPTSSQRRQTEKLLQRRRLNKNRPPPLVISKTPSPPKLAKSLTEEIKKQIINSPFKPLNKKFILEIPKPDYVVSNEEFVYMIKQDKTREIFTLDEKNKLQSTGQYYKNEW
jgi:hypothetical protein